jgi:hypothetical protein
MKNLLLVTIALFQIFAPALARADGAYFAVSCNIIDQAAGKKWNVAAYRFGDSAIVSYHEIGKPSKSDKVPVISGYIELPTPGYESTVRALMSIAAPYEVKFMTITEDGSEEKERLNPYDAYYCHKI